MFCPNCGEPIAVGDECCPSCGHALDRERMIALAENAMAGTSVSPDSEDARPQERVGEPPSQRPLASPDVAQGGSEALNDSRELISYILLSLVTCGIYGYYFLYKLVGDINVACADDGEETPGVGTFILLSLVTFGFYAFWWHYKLGNRLQANAPRYGLEFSENGTTLLVWDILGSLLCGLGMYVSMYIVIKNSNAICGGYNAANGLVWH